MKRMLPFFVLFSGLALAACESVETTVFIGERVQQNLDKWSGVWHVDDSVIFLKGEDDGVLHAAFVEWGGGEFVLKQFRCIVTTLDGNRYVHIPEDEPEGVEHDGDEPRDHAEREARYGFMVIDHPEANRLIVTGSMPSAFREAVEAGKLRGEVIRGAPRTGEIVGKPQRTILRDKDSLNAFIRETPKESLFSVDEPLKLRRLTADEQAAQPAEDEGGASP